MKLKLTLMAALAAMALAGCSSDEEPATTPADTGTVSEAGSDTGTPGETGGDSGTPSDGTVADTGTPPADTGAASETGGDTGSAADTKTDAPGDTAANDALPVDAAIDSALLDAADSG